MTRICPPWRTTPSPRRRKGAFFVHGRKKSNAWFVEFTRTKELLLTGPTAVRGSLGKGSFPTERLAQREPATEKRQRFSFLKILVRSNLVARADAISRLLDGLALKDKRTAFSYHIDHVVIGRFLECLGDVVDALNLVDR